MIAKKMVKYVEGSSVIRAMFEEGKKMAQKYGAENVYDFSLGNPSTLPPKAVNQAIIDVVNNEEPNRVHGYMNNSGFEDVRDAIAKSLNERFETDFSEKNILMTVGAAGGLNVILKSIIDPGMRLSLLHRILVSTTITLQILTEKLLRFLLIRLHFSRI